jgi:hypothetical protein
MVLLTGGIDAFNPDGSSGFTPTAELYDPASDTFRRTAGELTQTRAGHSQVLLSDGTVLLLGGGTGDGSIISATAEIYDPATDAFAAVSSMSTTRGLVTPLPLTR